MAVRTNLVPAPRPGRNLSAWIVYNASASVNSYAEGDRLRIDNSIAADDGRLLTMTLAPGSYVASVKMQTGASCQNACFVVRRTSDYNKYVEQHITAVNTPETRVSGSFTLTATTEVTIVLGNGSYGAPSPGTAFFGEVMIEATTALGAYFDGDTPDTGTTNYSWAGTPYASASTADTTTTTPTPPPNSGGTDSALEAKVRAVWEGIKYRYIRVDGAVRQREADDKITSEGQAYAAMVAVQLDDRTTFDLVESFSTNVLERRNYAGGFEQAWRANTANDPRLYAPTLMAWDYRPNPYRSNPANTVYDWNFATDADVDRAKALFWAYARWGNIAYLNKALAIVRELKLYGFATKNGVSYLTTDEFQTRVQYVNGEFSVVGPGRHLSGSPGQPVFEMNVSYIDPSMFHLAKERGNDAWWDQALAGAWDIYTKVSDNAGGIPTTAGVFPDWNDYWFSNDDANSITAGQRDWPYTRSTDYKYDAFRTVHRLAWSYRWYSDPQIPTILAPLKTFYASQWTTYGTIAAEYSHTGTRLSGGYEKPMMTAGAVLALELNDPSNATAAAIRTAKLNPNDRYSTNDGSGYAYWNDAPGAPFSYFGDFWLQMFYMRDAGLWTNWGQGSSPVGGTPVNFEVLDVGTGTDAPSLGVAINFEVLDSGTGADVADLTGPVLFEVIDSGGSSDLVDLTVAGEVVVVPPPDSTPVVVERWRWITPDGDESIELTNFTDGIVKVRGAAGLYSPPVNITKTGVPGMPGMRITDARHGESEVSLPLYAYRGSRQALQDLMSRLAVLMDATKGDGTLRHERLDGTVRELKCRCIGGLTGAGDGSTGPVSHRFELVFQASDPYWYAEQVTRGFTGATARSWFPMLPLRLTSSSVIGDIVIDSVGDVEAWPVWTIVGPGSAPRLENKTTGGVLELADVQLEAGQVITIDTRPYRKRVIGPDGSNWFRYLTSRQMWPLLPGRNEVMLNLVNATEQSYVSVAYRDRKLSS